MTSPSLTTLLKRLGHYGVIAHDLTSTDDIAMLIRHNRLEMVLCSPAIVDGKRKALNFEQYYREVFGRGIDGRKGK